MLADLRYAFRSLARAPGFVLAAVLCLGLGLGANTTVYSLVNGMMLRPLPYAAPTRLVAVTLAKPTRGWDHNALSMPYFLDLRERSRALLGLVAWTTRRVTLVGAEGPESLVASQVSADFFSVVGVAPLVGRAFRLDESAPGAPRVVLLGESLWRSQFGADRGVVGRTVSLDGAPSTIVGVMPDHVGLSGDREALWVPLAHDADPTQRGSYYLSVIGRLRDGATMSSAAAELETIAGRLADEHPDTDRDWVARVEPLRASLVPNEISTVFAVMLGAVGFVLLIACANVANLLLARTTGRQREIAVRSALGAARIRIIRLVLGESLLVSLAGGALGVAIAYFGLNALVRSIPLSYPSWIDFSVDRSVLAYAFLLSLATGALFGVLPALRASRTGLAATLRDGGRGVSAASRRLRDGLVMGELALSMVLLVGAGLMVKSFLRMETTDPGFAPSGVLSARLFLAGDRYTPWSTRLTVYRGALEHSAAVPGAGAVAVMSAAPLAGFQTSSAFTLEGQPSRPGDAPLADYRAVSSGTLALLGVPLVGGRDITPAESLDSLSTSIVIGEAMAHRFWPNASALGRRVAFTRPAASDSAPRWLTIVGIARDVKWNDVGEKGRNQVWRPYATAPTRTMAILVRTDGDAASLAPALRRAIADIDPALPIAQLRTLDGIVQDSMWRFKLYGWLFGTFAIAALLLAVVGVYGVVAYQVARRARELGVRVALGARPADIYRLVLGDGARLAGVGLGVGLVLAFGLTRVLRSALFQVSATDPIVFGLVAASLLGATLAASWIPARRATRIDATVALTAD